MILSIRTAGAGYDVVLERGCLQKAAQYLNLSRRVLILTDDGVPPQYAETLAAQCVEPHILTVPQGEGSKSFAGLQTVLSAMLSRGFTRGDCVAAVGGGVVGDLAGFAASAYMRGVDFYNIPTTVLSQVDSSIGGKTAINLDGVKNIVGAFYPPRKVLVDPDVLATLPARQISNGLAEAVKMSLTSDAALFSLFERDEPLSQIDTIIERSLRIKASVVEQDEKEQGLRRILNFGHTIGHAIESFEGLHGLYHGECVALGMLPMCAGHVRARLVPVLQKLRLPTGISLDPDAVMQAMLHDKKMQQGGVTAVFVDEVGTFRLQKTAPGTLRALLTIIPTGEENV